MSRRGTSRVPGSKVKQTSAGATTSPRLFPPYRPARTCQASASSRPPSRRPRRGRLGATASTAFAHAGGRDPETGDARMQNQGGEASGGDVGRRRISVERMGVRRSDGCVWMVVTGHTMRDNGPRRCDTSQVGWPRALDPDSRHVTALLIPPDRLTDCPPPQTETSPIRGDTTALPAPPPTAPSAPRPPVAPRSADPATPATHSAASGSTPP